MPKLPSYEQSVGPATFTAPTLGTGAVQSPAVAGITQANLGDGILKAGTNFAQTATKLAIANRTRRDQTLYLDLSNQFTEWNINARRDISMLTGKEAIGSTTEFMKSSKEYIDMLVQDVDPRIQSAIRERLEANALSGAQTISVHEATQHQAYEQTEAANHTLLTARNAVGFLSATGTKPLVVKTGNREETTYINDTDANGNPIPGLSMEAHYAIADAKQAAFDEQITLGAGEDTAEKIAQDVESEIFVDYANQIISDFPLHGVHFLDQYEGKIVDATTRKTLRETAENAYFAKSGFDKGVDLFTSNMRQEQIQGDRPITRDQIDANVAVMKRTLILNQNMDSRERNAALNSLTLMSNQAKDEIQANVNTSIKNLTRVLTTTNGDLSQANATDLSYLQLHDPKAYLELKTLQNALLAKTPVITDITKWRKLYELRENSPEAFKDENLDLYAGSISSTDMKDFIKMQEGVRNGSYYGLKAHETKAINQGLGYLQLTDVAGDKKQMLLKTQWLRFVNFGFTELKKEFGVTRLSETQMTNFITESITEGTWWNNDGDSAEGMRFMVPKDFDGTSFYSNKRVEGGVFDSGAPVEFNKAMNQLAKEMKLPMTTELQRALYNYTINEANPEEIELVEEFKNAGQPATRR